MGADRGGVAQGRGQRHHAQWPRSTGLLTARPGIAVASALFADFSLQMLPMSVALNLHLSAFPVIVKVVGVPARRERDCHEFR